MASSVNLIRRFNRLLIETSIPINIAYLKQGYFSLDILELYESLRYGTGGTFFYFNTKPQ